MGRVYVFGDEAGDLTFQRKEGASRYFMIGTATMAECGGGQNLLDLRREIAWKGFHLEKFHACEDKQWIRDQVFALIAQTDLRIDVTIFEKRKAYDRIRNDALYFYKLAWYQHLKHVAPRICNSNDELMVVASALQIKKKRQAVKQAVSEVVQQVTPTTSYHATFFSAVSDPCLQIADYTTWAIQRKWESQDKRSYDLVENQIQSEYDIWSIGTKYYF